MARLLQRRHFNVVVTAVANKMAQPSGRTWSKAQPLTRSNGILLKRLPSEMTVRDE